MYIYKAILRDGQTDVFGAVSKNQAWASAIATHGTANVSNVVEANEEEEQALWAAHSYPQDDEDYEED